MISPVARPAWAIPIAILAALFGLLTLKSGGEVLFVDGEGRAAAGSYVPYVVWFNFLAGFAYLAGAFGLAFWRPWVAPLAVAIAALTALVFAVFGVHVLTGGPYEPRTVGAMSLRCIVWIGIAVATRRRIAKDAAAEESESDQGDRNE